MENGQYLAKKKEKKIWFFDDDSYNTPSQYQSNFIRFFQIEPDTPGVVSKKYHTTTLAQEDNNDESYYPNSGVKVKHLEKIIKRINKIRALVFDWDKTLTLFEGVRVGRPTEGVTNLKNSVKMLKIWKYIPENWSLSHLAKYILHDSTNENRFNKLSETLKLAESKKIPIFILTNNVMGTDQKKLFVDIFKELGVYLPITHILRGGSRGPNRRYYSFNRGMGTKLC